MAQGVALSAHTRISGYSFYNNAMPLDPGSSLASYRIVGPLGAGAMGEVYRARDTNLDRDVAIKILPEELSHDTERLQRLQREAKLLAQMNEDTIATLHGMEESRGTRFLVMELVEGETLEEHLTRGPIPLAEARVLLQQIAEGLSAAHDKGIVHRDLKPANIKITPKGRVKILDFGLAKALPRNSGDESTSLTPTLAKATTPGLVVGTPSYMSPEQARGLAVDRRSDVWAFGCVMYECLTGRSAFTGATVSDVIASVLDREPDWNTLPTLPERMRYLLKR